MNEKHKENLSAFMDGEYENAPQIIEFLENEPELQGVWQRYHLIRDTLHQRLAPGAATDLAQRVSAAIAAEPTVIAPRRPGRRVQKALKPVAGMAIAASIAVMAVLGVQTLQQTSEPVPQLAQNPSPVVVTQVASNEAPANTPETRLDAETESKLSGYLVNHNEYSASAQVQGILPYTRIVSFTPSRRIED